MGLSDHLRLPFPRPRLHRRLSRHASALGASAATKLRFGERTRAVTLGIACILVAGAVVQSARRSGFERWLADHLPSPGIVAAIFHERGWESYPLDKPDIPRPLRVAINSLDPLRAGIWMDAADGLAVSFEQDAQGGFLPRVFRDPRRATPERLRDPALSSPERWIALEYSWQALPNLEQALAQSRTPAPSAAASQRMARDPRAISF